MTLPPPPPPGAPDLTPPPGPRRNWWSRNWKWVVPVGCLMPLLICGGFVTVLLMVVFGAIKNAAPYQEAVAAAEANPVVVAALGTPIEPGLVPSGSIETTNGAGQAELAIPISGPRGSGIIIVNATSSGGEWTYPTLFVRIDETGEEIDLLSLDTGSLPAVESAPDTDPME